MMKSVIIKNKCYIIFFSILFICCKNNEFENNQKDEFNLYFFDVIGNSNIDTLIVENSLKNKFSKSISIVLNNKKTLICEIKPRIDSSFILTSPKIENIYLESNNVQTNNKGFRLLTKNTDIEPEYFFMDLSFDKKWLVKEIGFLDISADKPFICKKNIQKNINEFDDFQIDPKVINQIYFNGNYCNVKF